MDTADRIGLLPGFGWIAGNNFWITLIICVIFTPVGHLLVGFLFESRLVPITPNKQFLSFFPGDLFLAVSMAGLLTLASDLPAEKYWYNDPSWHLLLLAFVAATAAAATYSEWKSMVYPTRAILSPTKLYHNGVLYVVYGYAIVATLAALIAGSQWSWWLLAALIPGLIWSGLVVHDSSLRPEKAREKAKHAHVSDWEMFSVWNH